MAVINRWRLIWRMARDSGLELVCASYDLIVPHLIVLRSYPADLPARLAW